MIFAVRRADGTYRAWSRNAPDEPLQEGETREELTAIPTVTLPLALQGVDLVRDAYVKAKASMTTFSTNPTLATAKPALIDLGQCMEELLKALNRAIAAP